MARAASTPQTDDMSSPLPLEGATSALPDGVRLTVSAVARRLGVAPATLRTWDRRYGIGPSDHSVGAHRRYTAADVARLDDMHRLLMLGVSPAEAARSVVGRSAESGPTRATREGSAPPQVPDGSSGSRAGGGQVVAIPGGAPSARGLARAAMALDGDTCRSIISASVEHRGVSTTWNQLLVPVLVGVGQRWEDSGEGVEVEHLLSEVILAVMQSRTSALEYPINQRSVLVACAPEDLHTLPLFILAAALAERRVSCRILGARVPHESLISAVRRTGPGAVLVWSQHAFTGDLGQLVELPRLRPAPLVLLGGPGWTDATGTGLLPVEGLDEAVVRICDTVCL